MMPNSEPGVVVYASAPKRHASPQALTAAYYITLVVPFDIVPLGCVCMLTVSYVVGLDSPQNTMV